MSTDTQIKEVLSRALSIIEDHKNWTQGFMARDGNNNEVTWSDPKATKYCLLGALWKASSQSSPKEEKTRTEARREAEYKIEDILEKIPQEYENLSIESFNDNPETMHEDVIHILKETIERC